MTNKNMLKDIFIALALVLLAYLSMATLYAIVPSIV